MSSPLLEVQDLGVRFRSEDGDVVAVSGVDFELALGETLCLLGESGSGKTVTMRALMRLLPPTASISGRVVLDGTDVTELDNAGLRTMRGRSVAMVFQDPMTALDPVFTIGTQIAEPVVVHEGISRAAARTRALELLEMVQIPSARRRLDAYPHELSGGLRQRAMIALALSCRPKLLLADEPTTALDATVQIQILLLMRELQRELGMSLMIVTHDIGVACEMADRVAVMYAGRFVETAPVADLMAEPKHPYTLGLLASTVDDGARGRTLTPIGGFPPDLARLPPGCAFAPRCPRAADICTREAPALVALGQDRRVRCHLVSA
jgi:peptide/nickel transport system ATP-binding protein